jgi:GNAT superfamily N-acetyltransferase
VRVTVRRLRVDEGQVLKALRLRALAGAPDAFGQTLAEASARDDWGELARTLSGAEGNAGFLAEAPEGAVGLAYGILEAERADAVHVAGMWVDPAWRGRGVGAALVASVIDWARARGRPRVCLWVTEQNRAAVSLYARMGFRPTGERAPLPSNPSLPAIEMELDAGAAGPPAR